MDNSNHSAKVTQLQYILGDSYHLSGCMLENVSALNKKCRNFRLNRSFNKNIVILRNQIATGQIFLGNSDFW